MSSNYKIISFGKKEENLVIALEHKTIGSPYASFENNIEKGDHIFLLANGIVYGVGIVTSSYFHNTDKIWNDKIYPHRFYFKLVKKSNKEQTLDNMGVNKEMRLKFGKGWGFSYIFAPRPLPKNIAKMILDSL